jgi:hypothetical protein
VAAACPDQRARVHAMAADFTKRYNRLRLEGALHGNSRAAQVLHQQTAARTPVPAAPTSNETVGVGKKTTLTPADEAKLQQRINLGTPRPATRLAAPLTSVGVHRAVRPGRSSGPDSGWRWQSQSRWRPVGGWVVGWGRCFMCVVRLTGGVPPAPACARPTNRTAPRWNKYSIRARAAFSSSC